MSIPLFFNPAAAAGSSAMRLGAALAHFRSQGVDIELHRPDSAAATLQAMKELAGQAERLIVVGGDGTVHLAANALAGTSTVLGVISAGTGNDTVTSLGLSNDVEHACVQALSEPTAIDLIQGPKSIAVTVATAGFSVDVNERADGMKRVRGAAKYTLSSLIELPRLRAHGMTMTIDGIAHEIEANLIAVANTAYFGGGMKIAPTANPTSETLQVVVIGPAPRAAFATLLPTVFSGRHIKSRYVTTYEASTIELAGTSLSVRADGEPFGSVPMTLSVRPKDLLVAGVELD